MTALRDPLAWNDWYVLSFANEITPGTSEKTRLLGEDLTILRDADGAFSGEWHKSDESIVPLVYLREQYGFLWACLGSPAHGIVAIAEFEDTERRFIHRGRIGVPSSGQRVIENFFDLSHFSFVHTGTLGGYESAEVPKYGVEFREEGRELWATGCSFYQPQASAGVAAQSTKVFYDYRIAAPFIAIIYKDSLVKPGRKDVIGLFVQPHEEESCTVHSFALVFDERNTDTHILHFYHEIFMQDRMILIHQTPRKLPLNAKRELAVSSDASSIAYRRWLDKSGMQFGVERS